MTYACGCLRGGVVCIEGRLVVAACVASFNEGMTSGNWRKFEDARERLEEHLMH